MVSIKHKVLSGFPCNNEKAYAIVTEDFGTLLTGSKVNFDKVMEDGFIELEHEDEYSSENVL